MKKICYRCISEATEKEHIPALSFFPKNERINLIKVPSCSVHNTEKSKDVEYVRNLFAITPEVNQKGFLHSINKVLRSFQRSDLFRNRVFSSSKDTLYLGEMTKSIKIEKDRLVDYLAGIGYGLFRYEFEENYQGHWYVHVDFSYKDSRVETSLSERELKIREFFRDINFPSIKGENPEVFKYSYMKEGKKIIIKLEFYESICAYLASENLIPDGENFTNDTDRLS